MQKAKTTPRPTAKPNIFDETYILERLGDLTEQFELANRETARPALLSIVVPAYNEEKVLETFENRTVAAMEKISQAYEIVFVNDGSQDKTLGLLHMLRQRNSNISIVNLSRNFGKEIALTAGLDYAAGDAIVVIDADLQDPPELISEMLAKWCEGYDVVYAVRTERLGETFLKKKTAEWFYRLMQHLGPVTVPKNVGDFRLMSRRVADALGELREQHRFMKGLYAWVGFPQAEVPYKRDPRHAGTTKWNYWKLWNLSLEGITAFTTIPLRAGTYLGLAVAGLAFLYGAWILVKTLAFGDDVQGFPTIMTTILFLGGVQLIGLGIIGEYLGRVFDETKKRPLYFVEHAVFSEVADALSASRREDPDLTSLLSESTKMPRKNSL